MYYETDFYTPIYEVTPMTMAIFIEQDKDGNLKTFILEEEVKYAVDHSPTRIIDDACKYLGVNLKERQKGTRAISGFVYKAPISIDPSCGMYFFPTTSPTNPKCSWIAHSHIKQVKKAGNNTTEILFKNGKRIFVDVSYGSIWNQVQRTAHYRYQLGSRLKYLKRHVTDIVAESPLP
ncbi:competence protein ComK [Virgibacillus ainsalahensis]